MNNFSSIALDLGPQHVSAYLPFESAVTHADDRAPAPGLNGRATARVCFVPARTSGQRANGHFVADAEAIAQALSGQFDPAEVNSPDSPEAALYRYLRDNDRHDFSLTVLPPDWPGLEAAFEQAFQRAGARAFCVCCNRNYLRPHTTFVRRPVGPSTGLAAGSTICSQYICPEGHLLLSVPDESRMPAAMAAA